jgi:plasmid stability protein
MDRQAHDMSRDADGRRDPGVAECNLAGYSPDEGRTTAMAILHIRNVPDDLYERLRLRAAAHHRSLSAEVIEILEAEAGSADRVARTREVLDRLEAFRATLAPVPKGYAADLVREGRGEI